MKTKEAIFHNKLVHYNSRDFPNGMKNAFYKAMQEYAEEYLQSEILKLKKGNEGIQTCKECGIFAFTPDGKMCMNGHNY